MNKIHNDRWSVGMLVLTFLKNKQAEITPTIPKVADLYVELNSLIQEILAQFQLTEMDNRGYAADKTEKRKKLIDAANKVGSAASIYYTVVVEDQMLRERARFTLTDMARLSTDALLNKARSIKETAHPIKTLLLPYGVSEATVDALQGHIDAFFNVRQSPAEIRTMAKTARKQVTKLLKDLDQLLEQLDTLFMQFYFSDTELYFAYKRCRKMRYSPTNHTIKQGLLKPASSSVAKYARGYLNTEMRITLFNQSARTKGGVLQFYFAAKKGDEPTPDHTIIELPADSEKTIEIGKHGFSAATPVLIVFNPSNKNIRWKTKVVLKEEE